MSGTRELRIARPEFQRNHRPDMNSLKLTLIAAAAIATVLSTSCATTRGFGQDLQKVGNKLENEAVATGGTAPARSTSTGIYTPPPSTSNPAAY